MNFDELYGSAKRIARRTAKKLGDTADLATLQIKLNAAQGKLEEAYTLLGRTAYLHFSSTEDLTERVTVAVSNVDAQRRKVRELKAQIEAHKARVAEEKRAEEESEAADATAEETPDGIGAEGEEEL